jgi:ABC-type nitrate/sulfonate/bicarbonate transport system substrate-binding protein
MEMPDTLSRRDMLCGATGAALMGFGPIGSALAANPMPITIANASGALNLTMQALMRQQKYLESFNLKPEVLPVADGSKILGAIVSGTVDASLMSGFGQIFPAIEHGARLKVLGGGALAPTTAMFTGKADINSLKDLEGRSVGIGSLGALVHQLVVALLRKQKVDISKVHFVNVGSSADIFRAVSAGTVDAGPAAASMIAVASRYHVRPIPRGNMAVELAEFTYQGAWTSDHAIQTRRDVIVRALAAHAKLYRFVQTPQAREPFLNARRSVFPAETDADHIAEWDYIQTYKPFAVNLVLEPQRLRYIQDLNVSFNVQKAVLPFDQVADMSLAREAIKLLG